MYIFGLFCGRNQMLSKADFYITNFEGNDISMSELPVFKISVSLNSK